MDKVNLGLYIESLQQGVLDTMWFLKDEFTLSNCHWPGTVYIDLASLKLLSIMLPMPPVAGITNVHHCVQLDALYLMPCMSTQTISFLSEFGSTFSSMILTWGDLNSVRLWCFWETGYDHFQWRNLYIDCELESKPTTSLWVCVVVWM